VRINTTNLTPPIVICITLSSTLQTVLIKDFASESTGTGSRASKIDVTKSHHRQDSGQSSKQILEPKLPPCSLLPAEVAVPSTRQKRFILQTPDIHQQLNYIKQLDLEKSFHLYSFDLPYPSTNTSPS
jgi:hypothetical protein